MEVQEVKSMGRSFDKTSSVAEYRNLDFSAFTRTCLEHAGAEEEIEVSLRGSKGCLVLRAFVKASLLNDLQSYEGEHVSSELSFMSEERTPASALDEEYIDDDDSQVRHASYACNPAILLCQQFTVSVHSCGLSDALLYLLPPLERPCAILSILLAANLCE